MKTRFRHTFYKKNYYLSMQQGILIGFLLLLLSIYLFTGIEFFGTILFIYTLCSLFYYFIKYLLRPKSDRELNATHQAQDNINQFQILLKDKNFLNHHNYFHFQENEQIYKKYLFKKSILKAVKTSFIISSFIILGGLADMFSSEMSIGVIASIFFIVFVLSLIITLFKTFWNYITKVHNKNIISYQKRIIHNKKFVSHRNKIFFY